MDSFISLPFQLVQLTALLAAKTDHEIMCDTPVFVVLADFQMIRVLTTDVQFVAKDALTTIRNTLINLTVRLCAGGIIDRQEQVSLPESDNHKFTKNPFNMSVTMND